MNILPGFGKSEGSDISTMTPKGAFVVVVLECKNCHQLKLFNLTSIMETLRNDGNGKD